VATLSSLETEEPPGACVRFPDDFQLGIDGLTLRRYVLIMVYHSNFIFPKFRKGVVCTQDGAFEDDKVVDDLESHWEIDQGLSKAFSIQ